MLDKAKVLEYIEGERHRWNEARNLGQEIIIEIKRGTFDAPLTEEVRQLREELDEYKKLVHEKHDELSKVTTQFGKEIERCCTLEKERDKLVKALEFYAQNEKNELVRKYGERARTILSEIKGQEDERNEQ